MDPMRLSSRFFSPEETARLRDSPADRLRERFLFHWVLKESYLKARGVGLSSPLDSFSFFLDGERPYSIVLSAADPAGREGWRFALLGLRGYVAAVGLFSDRSEPVRIRAVSVAPSGRIAPSGLETLGFSAGVEI